MSDALATLGKASRDYEEAVGGYREVALGAAHAEAAYKRESSKFKLNARAEDPKLSAAWAEIMADADDEISALYEERLVSAAILDSEQKRIAQLRERVSTGRTYTASERAADQIHARSPMTT